jgi:glycosyltransferase involved in cell wall biosynthesis
MHRRLLLISQPLSEGVPRHVLDLVEGLDPNRFELDVACPRESELWERVAANGRARLHEISAARRPSLSEARLWPRVLSLVRRADIVHAHSAKAGYLGRVAALLTGASRRTVFTPHAWSWWAADGTEAALYRSFERAAARACARLIVVSDDERRAGLEAGVGRPEQYRVILNGVDLDRFAAPRQPIPGRILALGRLSPQKRPDLAVEAFARVHERLPQSELLLAGRGPEEARVRELATRLGVEGAVRILGPREDVAELLATASCLVLSSDYEGCPLSVLEAMAAGVPVVATRVGGLPELIDHGRTGLLVDPGRPEALAEGIVSLLSDPETAVEVGLAARDEARTRFSRERMVSAIEGVYDELPAA